ncbi:uncharacterized protein LOC143017868 [Oratosquilla oratoria]|uniref:uncharacterized protein LOC143017868 n=1 Tax=Oratosquilla oratoria TaxID=337810 RepID=UPI003F75768B
MCDDIFDAVEELEKSVQKAGYNEGCQESQQREFEEGFQLGWQQVSYLRQEVGRVEGLLMALLCNCENELDPRTRKHVEKILTLARNMTKCKDGDENLLEANLRNLQMKAKFVLCKLKIDARFEDTDVDATF